MTPEKVMTTASEIDVSLIEERLRMTPTERWEAHRKALELVLEIRKARDSRLRSAAQGAQRRPG